MYLGNKQFQHKERGAMFSKLVIAGSLMAAAVTLAACDSSSVGPYAAATSPTPTSAPTAAPVYATPSAVASPQVTGITIKLGNSKLGEILVGPSGRTVYLFLADSGTSSNCNSASCVQNWPPVLTKGAPQAGPGVSASLLGTTTRKDGTTEVTYAGHPLYYFIADQQAGQVSGQGIDAFGAPWYVVSPSGMQIG
jgi:predicted lipoprotein with Yx(FWY)xxD motif